MSATILVIEDHPTNLYLVTFLLEKRGHRIVAAGDGPRGIELAGELRPDLILLDIQLPGLDGYGVARALKGDPALRAIPIVAVTSSAMAGDREKVLATGADGYLEKPIDPATFVADVEAFLPPGVKGRPRGGSWSSTTCGRTGTSCEPSWVGTATRSRRRGMAWRLSRRQPGSRRPSSSPTS